MEAETIVYFHPAEGEGYKNTAAKRHWWQEAALRERVLSEEETGGFFALTDCPVPLLYHKKKPWPPERLTEAMERVMQRARGMADAFLHPDIMTCVSEKYAARWETREKTMERLSESLLAAYAADCLYEKGRVTVLLGNAEETERQMAAAQTLLAPYLPRINGLLFYYEETAGTDIWEETAACLEDYSYEYGLVPAFRPYLQGEKGLFCDAHRCGGLILDFAPKARYPRLERNEKTIYADLVSDREKERFYGRKGGPALYVSPRKYLDTIVKSGYHG